MEARMNGAVGDAEGPMEEGAINHRGTPIPRVTEMNIFPNKFLARMETPSYQECPHEHTPSKKSC
jgi:hypothetical protein